MNKPNHKKWKISNPKTLSNLQLSELLDFGLMTDINSLREKRII